MSPLWWAGLAVAVVLAAWGLWQWHRARTPSTGERDEELPSVPGQYPPPDDDDASCPFCRRVQRDDPIFDRWADQALDVVAEPDHRRAEHMNRTLRRVEGGDET